MFNKSGVHLGCRFFASLRDHERRAKFISSTMKEEIQQTRLANGLTILTDRMPGVRSATLGFFFRVG